MKPPRSLVVAVAFLAPLSLLSAHEGEGDVNTTQVRSDRGNRTGAKGLPSPQQNGESGRRWQRSYAGCAGSGDDMSDQEVDACIDQMADQAAEISEHNSELARKVIKATHDKFHNEYGESQGGRVPIPPRELNSFKDDVVLRMAEIGEWKARLNERYLNGEISRDRFEQALQKNRDAEARVGEARQNFENKGGALGKLADVVEHVYETMKPKEPAGGGGSPSKPSGYTPGAGGFFSPAVPQVQQGYGDLANGDAAAASAAAQKALSMDPGNVDAMRLAAQSAALQRDYRSAADAARRALAIDPNDAKMQGLLAMTEGRNGTGGGETSNPSSAANMAAGMGYGGGSGGLGFASLPAKTAADAASNSLLRQGADKFRLGDYGEAEAMASKALETNPNNVNALYLRSLARASRGDLAGALKDAVAASSLDPNSAKLHAARAAILNRLGRYNEASDAAMAALERDPKDGNALMALLNARAGLGDRAGMEAAAMKLAENNPQYRNLYEGIVQAPQDADLLLLFNDLTSGRGAPAQNKPVPSRGRRFGSVALISLLGGGLLGLGLLKYLLPPLRSAFTRVTKRWQSAAVGVADPSEAATVLDTPRGFGGSEPALLRGQFRILKQIGQGGMGMVFEGEDITLGRRVAIKRMRDELKLDRRERERFVSEAKLVAALKHPNIVEIYSIAEENGDLYLVFEYVSGKTLHELVVSKGRMSLEESLPIMVRVADALEYAHMRAIIHRDLKPSNIMVDEEGKPRVMDFGIARAAKDALTRQQMTNTVVGTPPYMAPEQEQGLVRKESDVYSLAICLYEMLTGRLAFAGTGAGMLMNKINKTYAPITTLAPELPASLDEVFAKAFDPDPNKRYSTPKQLMAAVEAAAARKA